MAVACIEIILVALVAYLIGSINLSIILSKLMNKGDIREQGSKNAGTTNTLRVLGKGPALLVFIWDILKGVIAVYVARVCAQAISANLDATTNLYDYIYSFGIMLSSIAVILGHNYPAFFGFKGGKGVATSLGVILAIEWRIGLICLAAGVVGIALFQFVSVGSLIAAIEYPILVCIIGGQFDPIFRSNFKIRAIYILFSFVLAIMVVFKHRTNIERIKNGTENKLKFRKTPEEKIEEEKAKREAEEQRKAEAQEIKENNANVMKETMEDISNKVEEKANAINNKIDETVTQIKDNIDIKVEPKEEPKEEKSKKTKEKKSKK